MHKTTNSFFYHGARQFLITHFVFDLSDVTGVSVDFVVDDLFESGREDDAVRASYDLSITRLGMTKIIIR